MLEEVVTWIRRVSGRRSPQADPKPNIYIGKPAWEYQSNYVLPLYERGQLVVDVGAGHAPSPIATVTTDYFPDENTHRATRSMVEDRPVVVCSVDRMPFRDKSFDLSICTHVLEHVANPSRAAEELGRVSRAGYIETPAYGKDILIGTGGTHVWQVVSSGTELHFFPYTDRQHEAHRSSPFMDIWCHPEFHPLQKYFWDRQDLFNSIQVWRDHPSVVLHGPVPSEAIGAGWKPVSPSRLPDRAPALNDREITLLASLLTTPDGAQSMSYTDGNFVSADGKIAYPVRGKRVYFESGDFVTT